MGARRAWVFDRSRWNPSRKRYLPGRNTHRVAISNHRLVSLTAHEVIFRYRDRRCGNRKRLMTLAVEAFIRRFLLHVLPPRFVKIRYFGCSSTGKRR